MQSSGFRDIHVVIAIDFSYLSVSVLHVVGVFHLSMRSRTRVIGLKLTNLAKVRSLARVG